METWALENYQEARNIYLLTVAALPAQSAPLRGRIDKREKAKRETRRDTTRDGETERERINESVSQTRSHNYYAIC